MENATEVSFDDVVAVSIYVQSASNGVLDNEKKFDLMQTCMIALYAGMPVPKVIEHVDIIITKWAAFTNGQITAEELLGEDGMERLNDALAEQADEGGSVIHSTTPRTLH